MVWCWLWGISWLGWVVFWVLSNTFVFDVGNISTISISYVVGDNLGTAIGKGDTVFTVGGISVTGFVGLEVGVSIIVMDGISVLVYSWSFFIDWSLAISWSWGVVSWGMYNWLVDNWYNWGDVWSWLVYYWGNIWSWSMNWGWVVYWSWFVSGGRVAWSMSNSMAVSSGVTVLYCSMTFYFSIGNSQKGNKSDEGLENYQYYNCKFTSIVLKKTI